MSMNYQKELDKLLDTLTKEGACSKASAAQLLCTMQQLCVGISEQLF